MIKIIKWCSFKNKMEKLLFVDNVLTQYQEFIMEHFSK